jgi:hypothetical protein
MSEGRANRVRWDWPLAALLSAMGAGAILAADNMPPVAFAHIPMPVMQVVVMATALSGFMLLGAGIGAPFRRKMLGAGAGFMLWLTLMLVIRV